MKSPKIFFLSIGIVFFIIFLTLFLIIFPAYHHHALLKNEMNNLSKLESQSTFMKIVEARNVENVRLLNDQLHEKPQLLFIDDALKASGLLIESMKPDQGADHDEIHLIVQGEYRDLLNFIALLSREPNAIDVISLSIEKNHAAFVLKTTSKNRKIIKKSPASNLSKRLSAALTMIDIPVFVHSAITLDTVQSPFVSRVFLKNKNDPFQSLRGTDWHLSGQVRQEGDLLGVFLESREGVKSHYFGVNLPWENSDWRVMSVASGVVIFEEIKKHARWVLVYEY